MQTKFWVYSLRMTLLGRFWWYLWPVSRISDRLSGYYPAGPRLCDSYHKMLTVQFPKLKKGRETKSRHCTKEGHEYDSSSKNESNQMRIYQSKNITILRNPPVSELTGTSSLQIGSRLAWRPLPICWVRTIPVICFAFSPNRRKTEWLRFGPHTWNNLRESQSFSSAE